MLYYVKVREIKFYNRDMLSTQDWTKEELLTIIELAEAMQKDRFSDNYTKLLKNKTFKLLFFNPSVRTRQSFEAAATELGGHAQFLEPRTMRLKTDKAAGETIEDLAQVMSRYGAGAGIRILEDKISRYGEGHQILEEFSKHAKIPVINMGSDKFHPCQGLADVMGLRKHLGNELKRKKILVTWAKGGLARSWYSTQEILLMSSRFGLNVILSHPKGYDLDPDIIKLTKENCEKNNATFELTHDLNEAYNAVDVVYSRNWISPHAYQNGIFQKKQEIKKALGSEFQHWICDKEKMSKTNNALFMNPMPVDRGNEVTDEIASGRRSIIYDIAENRLHVQKALMALIMNKEFAAKFEK